MENFIYHNPTKILFGKNEVDRLGIEASVFGKKAMIVLGQSSARKSGLYARVVSNLNMHEIKSITYEGIKSNPTYQDVDEAVQLAKEENVDLIIAVGGGSVIDSAKAIAMGYYVDHSVWDFYLQKSKPTKALPIIAVLTLAATGTEMNSSTVLQDTVAGMKKGFSSPFIFPKISILDPSLSYSVPANYTAYGVADLFAHCLEVYFGKADSPLSDHYVASILRVAMKHTPIAIADPENYDARANIMWCATNALNGSLVNGKGNGDWGSHLLEHTLSVLYNVPHGAGLSVVFPAWLKHFSTKLSSKMAFLAREVFSVTEADDDKAAELFIVELEKFFVSIGTPIRLSELKIEKSEQEKILQNFKENKVNGRVHTLNEQDYADILARMW